MIYVDKKINICLTLEHFNVRVVQLILNNCVILLLFLNIVCNSRRGRLSQDSYTHLGARHRLIYIHKPSQSQTTVPSLFVAHPPSRRSRTKEKKDSSFRRETVLTIFHEKFRPRLNLTVRAASRD